MKAFIFDPLWNDLIDDETLGKLSSAGIEVVLTTDMKPLSDTRSLFEGDEDRLLCLNPDYVNWSLKNEDYESIPNLKGIFTESTGYDWVQQEAAVRLGIPICNIIKFNTESIAEWAIMMMLTVARQIPMLIKDSFPLDFDKDFMKYRGLQLKGKTAGIIGLGAIGSAIAERCNGLGMNVAYWSRSSSDNSYKALSLSLNCLQIQT
jgi:phosphoglycerate dehydrogenase-like enzyme